MNALDELLTRRVANILPSPGGLKKLLETKKIRLYQGFDPSSPNLHLGHLVGLLQLKAFQDLGHEVIFLIGDFTGMIGDPTDKTAARPKLTHAQIIKNAQTYQAQAGKILNFSGPNPAKMVFNYEWLSRLTFADLIEITSNLTVQQLIERDMFQERLKKQAPIYLHEFLYPVAQGYDSIALDVDLEVGGNDQMFNLLVGRQLLKSIKHKEKYCLTTKLLSDPQGRKIGKTTGNAINLFGSPNDLFGAVMSQPDSLIIPGFELATEVSLTEIESLKKLAKEEPMKAKKRFAYEVVKICHDVSMAKIAQSHFESVFQKVGSAANLPEVTVSAAASTLIGLLKQLNLGVSNAQLKRVVEEGGVELNGQKLTDSSQALTPKSGDVIKFGKHTFCKLMVNS